MALIYDSKYQRKKEWNERNREKVLAKQRRSLLGGKWKGLNKRDHPGRCELCSSDLGQLGYHHWDDTEPSLGVWLCQRCHRIAEAADDPDVTGLTDLYLQMKVNLSADYFKRRLL